MAMVMALLSLHFYVLLIDLPHVVLAQGFPNFL